MTFEMLWREALLAALAGNAVLGTGLNRIGDGEGEAAGMPFALLGEIVGSDWGAKGFPGRELRFSVSVSDRGDVARIAGLASAVEAVLGVMPRAFSGWECGGVSVLRTRNVRRRDGVRLATVEARVRGWRI